ncbi:hypothetical protein [Viridibacterium curvum]|uniref:Hemerythrin-like domain-containing protein n=1 Tax=Viridibacterium curvum TaxID=1101404 RepID=A0ABP9QWP1_9RHOO
MQTNAQQIAATQSATGRFNIYNFPHKGLRLLMQHTLHGVGSCDWQDASETAETLTAVRTLLEVMTGHLHHENAFIHVAMEARQPGSTRHGAGEHVAHEQAIAALHAEVTALEQAADDARDALGYHLYTRLSLFVAENLEHMAMEERDHNAVLWANYADDEILDIERRLVSAIPPEKAALMLPWMVQAANAGERAGFLCAVRPGMPAEAFDGLLSECRALLSPRAWAKLEAALRGGVVVAA